MDKVQTFFRASLFDLFETADKVVIDGYEIETMQDIGKNENGDPIMRCEVSDDEEWNFKNQEVKVSHQNGRCVAMAAESEADEPFEVEIDFVMERKIEEGDLAGVASRESRIESTSSANDASAAPLTENELAGFMLERIENGQIAVEDIPLRLARYGLMDPAEFIAEMRERMENARIDSNDD